MMRLINLWLLSVCLLSSPVVKAQKARLLYASSQLNDLSRNDSIQEISYTLAWSTLKLRYQNGSVKRVPKVSVWGYIDSQGNIYRQYKKDFFKLIRQGNLINYTNVCFYCSGSRFPRPTEVNYYSKNLNSKIYRDSTVALSNQ